MSNESQASSQSKSQNLYIDHRRGLQAEEVVKEDLFRRQVQILHSRLKTPFAEVDLVCENLKNQIVIFEVKTLSKWNWLETRLSSSQIKRLKRASEFLSSKWNADIILVAAFVLMVEQKKPKIFYLPIE